MNRCLIGIACTALIALPAGLKADVTVQNSTRAQTLTSVTSLKAKNVVGGAVRNLAVPNLEVPANEGGIAGGLGVVCVNPSAAQCQLPDQLGHDGTVGATSDANPDANFGVVDNFVTAANATITTVCWWGFYLDFTPPGATCGPVADAFTITYYNNSPGCPDGAPGTIKAGPFAVTATRAATGLVIPSGAGDLPEFEYTATHAGVNVTANTCTWIEIQNSTVGVCFWLWSTAPPGDADSHQFNAPDPENNFDLAFCVNANLGAITTQCSLAVTPSCVGALGECGAAHGNPGCNDPCCCTAVCTVLPLCCVNNWDADCASAGLDLGCATFPLCQPEANCQVYGDGNAFNSTSHPDPTPDSFIATDDFTVTTTGTITTICWQGAYSAGALADSFRVRYYEDNNKLPGTLKNTFSQTGGTLIGVTRNDTARDIEGTTASIFQYTATHGPVNVTAGNCYWIEISNDQPAGSSWFWEWAEEGRNAGDLLNPLPQEGNGMMLIDGDGTNPPNGYTDADILVDNDMAFCLGKVLQTPACDLFTVHHTGPHEPVLFNGAPANLGWSSGSLDAVTLPQRRVAQAFTLPPLGGGLQWNVDQLAIEGFDPAAGVVNNFINFEIYNRTGFGVAPNPGSSEVQIFDVPFDSAVNVDPVTNRVFLIFAHGDLVLPPGNYWLTMFASNTIAPFTPSNFAWFTNAPEGLGYLCQAGIGAGCAGNVGCPGQPAGTQAVWRACTYPAPGFQGYVLAPAVLDVDPAGDPTPDRDDLYNGAIIVRAQPVTAAPPCPWDCGGVADGNVAIVDFLALLAQWSIVGAPCDFDGGGVAITDFLKLLANWGPCP